MERPSRPAPTTSRRHFVGLALPLRLHKRLLERADAIGVSINTLIVDLLETCVDAQHDAGEKEPAHPMPTIG
jgi:predicted HicB family RNase H-like nuclease